ncbi:DUF4391 domain-containing protein [Phocaeicola plebeius]|jgi:hypothetical protein|uniref:DUF4391 domain-containing protein n=1 Tax=Phocaeicola plebeius TaxID=310297 RepID=UPI00241DBD56|nr:DUF4391 domain-containing protein [Phocaeicola plebeius]
MDNVLHFPLSTIVDKNVPKNAFFGRASVEQKSTLKDFLTREFESIVWLYKLAPATLNVEDGEYVHEIDVFYCRMKENEYSIKPFSVMDELLPRHTVFIIEYGEKLDLLMHHKEMSVVHGEQKWKCGVSEIQRDIRIDADTLNIQGQSMDAVYNGLLSQISGLSASTREEYKEQVDLRKQIEFLWKQVTVLQKKIKAEKQFNRQMELSAEMRKLKKEIIVLSASLK